MHVIWILASRDPFCLGEPWCSEWGCCIDMEPPKKKATAADHFSASVSRSSMENICKGYMPKNMGKATVWALWPFNEW